MPHEIKTPLPDTIAAFEHLTGSSRGDVSWVHDRSLRVALDNGVLAISADPEEELGNVVARLRRAGVSYKIKALPGRSIWVNGELAAKKKLEHGDVIEFDDTGPLTRFRLYGPKRKARSTVETIISDGVAYLRTSRRPIGSRLVCAGRDLIRRIAFETSFLFRATVVAALIGLAVFSYEQSRFGAELERTVAEGAEQLDGVATTLARAQAEALRPSDLATMRAEIAGRVSANIERLESLERRFGAGARIIAQSTESVAFIQGAYGVREPSSGRMLRHVTGRDGLPLMTPGGQPLLTLEGDGPLAEIQFTGTGFFVEGGLLVTNRHVALPWESGPIAEILAANGHEPVLLKLIGYIPGRDDAVALERVAASETADLALLRAEAPLAEIDGLSLADRAPRAGDEIILMGYPTGLRSMLAQSGLEFVDALQATGVVEFWSVAERLSADGLISPLASRGIVGNVGSAAIVYDAETTHGGSGGPVLNLQGEVIAVNTAILPEFGGSNLGVPVEEVRALLDEFRPAPEEARLRDE